MIDLNTHYYKKEDVLPLAEGRWVEILGSLAPELMPALEKAGRHVACPKGTGKRDGFRVFRDVAETGSGVSNQDGVLTGGLSMLMWVNDEDFLTTLNDVGNFLGVEPRKKRPKKAQGQKQGFAAAQQSSPQLNSNADSSSSSYLAAKNGGIIAEPEVESSEIPFDDLPAPHTPQAQAVPQSAPAQATAQAQAVPQPAPAEATAQAQVASKVNPKLVAIQERLKNRAEASDEEMIAKTQRTWAQCISIMSPSASPAREYLNARGIRLGSRRFNALADNDALRFHPALPYYQVVDEVDGSEKVEKVGEFPTLMCGVKNNDGELITIHRTYLEQAFDETGEKSGFKKANVECPRKMMPVPESKTIAGAAIATASPSKDGIMAVAEGLETALSGYRATGIPAWAAINANMLERFEPPEGVRTLIIWADKDHSLTGELSANALHERMAERGIKVVTLLPQHAIPEGEKSIDWNDVLLQHGVFGFPLKRKVEDLIGQSY